ncbi:hypothetical protein [Algoriphagus vanfongensis]|uniref:hypothetical protein n=1 Tax=Algoriphagus vanfongensis TaxID=426371 RepID=UPI0012FCF3C8|nr:hypothetical protein [Algoriphagus vanfongensis]
MFSIKLIKFYLLISILTILTSLFLFNAVFSFRNIVNIILLVTPVFYFIFISVKLNSIQINKLLKFLFWLNFFIYLFSLISSGVSFSSLIDSIFSFDFVNSDVDTESTSSLYFCFFVLFFLSKKNYKLFFFALFLTVIGGKRIAILASLFSSFVYLLLINYKILLNYLNSNLFKYIFSFLLLICGNLWFLLYSGYFDNVIQDYTGLSSNAFFMGRLSIAGEFFNYKPDEFDFFLGYGVGYVDNVLYNFANVERLFHNDFLRFILEFGSFFFFIWVFIHLKFITISPLAFSNFILILVLMQTDNVFLYEIAMYIFYSILSYSLILYKK